MDTQTNLPEHIFIGAYVQVAEWVGRVEDIAIGTRHTMILVSSPKQIYKNSVAEWLEYHADNSGIIQPANKDQYVRDCMRYRTMTAAKMKQLADIAGYALEEQAPQ